MSAFRSLRATRNYCCLTVPLMIVAIVAAIARDLFFSRNVYA
jgi:hypothetical protein